MRVKTLAELDKKITNSTSSKTKLGTGSLARPPPLCSSNSRNASLFLHKPAVCQAEFQRSQSNRIASIHIAAQRKLHKAEKTGLFSHTANGTHQQSHQNVQSNANKQTRSSSSSANKTQKSKNSSLVSIGGLSQSERGIPYKGTDNRHTKTDHQLKRPLDKKLVSVNMVAKISVQTTSTAKMQLKSQNPANRNETKIQTNNVSKTQAVPAKLPQKHRNQSAAPKLGNNSKTHNTNAQCNKQMTRKTQSTTERPNQRKDISHVDTRVDAAKSISLNSIINKATRTSVSSTVFKPANSGNMAVIKNKPQTAVKLTNATASTKPFGRNTKSSVLPQSTNAPQDLQPLTKRSSQAKPTVQFQTPKPSLCPSTQGVRTAPVDGRKKPTAAQEERLRKLQEWRDARGVTYKRPPMPVRLVRRKTVSAFPQPYWTSMEQEEYVHDFVFAVGRSLDDCIKLLQQGCPVEQVKDVLSRVPMAQKFAKYWICQARLMEREGNLEILPMFQEAVRVVREPVDELRSVVFEILKKRQAQDLSPVPNEPVETETDDEQEAHDNIMCTPKPVSALICGMRGDSSVVKYKITATPGGKRSQQGGEPGRVDGHEIRFFTPVRRSVRIGKTSLCYPTALQEHDPCVTSLCDLVVGDESNGELKGDAQPQSSPVYVFRENEALRDHVTVQLVYPDEVET
ncbi:cytoskeleton-associated protein 2-like isoform X2 [Xyrauchen texanus]|nr:cytoskeleton-associated protein 2-like isoform X2 [Xyrauchen texanus]XP_051950769.1 cytoskeleton-associated protein 2-like isoform X2 [Xyrauchen texanus]